MRKYQYDHQGVRIRKSTDAGATDYYNDGHKILGEDRPGNKKLRYFYDKDGLCGFRYYNGSDWKYYTYVKDTMGSIRMIKDDKGVPYVYYEYDSYGNAQYTK